VAELKARGVDRVSSGHVIVATWEPYQDIVFRVIHELGLELQVIFNKGAVMVLPSGVNKATGLAAALAELGLSPHNAVGVGDAENDHALLRACECSAAVANALPAVKDTADIVMKADHGAGVAELIDRMIGNDLCDLKTLARHRIPVGEPADPYAANRLPIATAGGFRRDIGIDPAGPGVMVCGTSGSGKSTLTTAILERLSDAGYQALVVDPEGDYEGADFVTHVGNPAHAPRLEDVTEALRDSRRSIVVNLLGVPLADRPGYFARLLPRILEEKARTGRPHWLLVDEAHHLLPPGPDTAALAPLLPDRGLMFVTVHPGSVEPKALGNVGTVFVVGSHPCATLAEFCRAAGDGCPTCPSIPGDKLAAGDTIAWWRGDPDAVLLHTKKPRTERKRHSRKYAEGNLGPERSFYFRGPGGKMNLKASNLHLFLHMGDGVDDETWEFHRRQGDFSKWVRERIKDAELADELAEVERDGSPPADARAAIRAAVQNRYTLPADAPSGQVGDAK
jgi:hypothetical protein